MDVSKERLQEALNAKDWKLASNWCYNIAILYYYMNNEDEVLKYQMKGVGYGLRSFLFRSYKKYSNDFLPDNYSRSPRSIWFNEQAYEECMGCPRVSILGLKMAIMSRRMIEASGNQELSVNKFMVSIDKSKIKMLQNDFEGAKENMTLFLTSYRNSDLQCTEVSYEAFQLLGEICTITSEYEEALRYYQECLVIAKELEYQDLCSIYAKIGRLYNLLGKFELSSQINTRLLHELEEKNIAASEIILADVYYNIAELNGLITDYDVAMDFLDKAEHLYNKYVTWRTHCKIGKARCLIIKARILLERNRQEEGNLLMQEGVKALEDIFGDSHLEVRRIKNS